jgi:hypothetical protein
LAATSASGRKRTFATDAQLIIVQQKQRLLPRDWVSPGALPEALIQLPGPQQDVLEPIPHLLRAKRLAAHRSVRIQGVHDRVHQGHPCIGRDRARAAAGQWPRVPAWVARDETASGTCPLAHYTRVLWRKTVSNRTAARGCNTSAQILLSNSAIEFLLEQFLSSARECIDVLLSGSGNLLVFAYSGVLRLCEAGYDHARDYIRSYGIFEA